MKQSRIFLILAIVTLLSVSAIAASLMLPALQTKETNAPESDQIQDVPVRLISDPLMSHTGRIRDTIFVVLDLLSREQANAICQMGPYLNDALQAFFEENPDRMYSRTRILGRDPELQRYLSKSFPDSKITEVRLSARTHLNKIHTQMDIYECRTGRYSRFARKIHK